MDPELRAAIAGLPYVGLADPRAARAAMRELVAVLVEPAADGRVEVTGREVPGPPGAPPVPVRVYRPRRARRPAPVLVYFHGGGFVTGDLENEHRRCLDVAAEEGIAVVSAEYRLAPEHPFPAGFDDCYAVTCWTHRHAAEFGGDPARIAVGGGSAGGALAAGVALRARDEDGPPLAFQLLLYPVLDDRMDTPSMRAYTEPPLFNRTDVTHMWRHYLGGLAEAPPYAAPARAADLSGLPPAYVLAAEADPLRDEDLAYALRLIAAGVPTELRHVPGVYHGFDGVTSAEVARRALAEQRAVLRRALDSVVD
ncbi:MULTISPECIES: alpha/beta hydrolase [Thermomonosporaceae]|uniref:alpha/beta hydrolase n=1 Tax=Thermomonosporaceae TaxID=2012 RepID=UPI00255B2D25|nr:MULTISPECIES: alpha/beta hydrolase [Thermomonosporaceae]MDL4771959.1 alpha/beta hydrolase [Actinomadura xylanilytica]